MNQKCLECGRDLGRSEDNPAKHYFCSIECACYSGCYSVKTGMNMDKFKALVKEKLGEDLVN